MKHLLLSAAVAIGAATATATAQDVAPLPTPTTDEAMTLRRSTALEIASAYGFDRWEQIQRIDFTFNVETDKRQIHRKWTWWTKESRVTLQRDGKEVAGFPLVKGSIMLPVGINLSGEAAKAHKQFINDSYWFLFPFQIVWSNPQVTDHGEASRPIGEGAATKVTVQYPDVGGYTPGDAYDLYLGDDHRILQWVYRRGGGEKGSPMTWETVRSLGPIVVTLDHWSPGHKSHLYFSDVSVVVADEDGQTARHEPTPLEGD